MHILVCIFVWAVFLAYVTVRSSAYSIVHRYVKHICFYLYLRVSKAKVFLCHNNCIMYETPSISLSPHLANYALATPLTADQAFYIPTFHFLLFSTFVMCRPSSYHNILCIHMYQYKRTHRHTVRNTH